MSFATARISVRSASSASNAATSAASARRSRRRAAAATNAERIAAEPGGLELGERAQRFVVEAD